MCKHENTTKKNIIIEDIWGSMQEVEYTEVCLECGKERLCSYGGCEDWSDEDE